MVSIYEKQFIDKVAGVKLNENDGSISLITDQFKLNESQNFDAVVQNSLVFRKDCLLKSLDVCENNDKLLHYEQETSNKMPGVVENFRSVISQDSSCCNSYEWSNLPRKKIVWDELVINQINNTLNEINASSISSCNSGINRKCLMESSDEFGWADDNRSLNNSDVSMKEYYFDSNDLVFKEKSVSTINEKNDLRKTYKRNKIRNLNSTANKHFGELQDPKKTFNKKQLYRSRIFSYKDRIDQDGIIDNVCHCSHRYVDWIRNNQPKIALLGDSHARLLGDIIVKMLPGFRVDSTVKPGAKSKQVVSSLEDILVKMTSNDFMVIISGTNDMWSEALEEAKGSMYNAVNSSAHTNLILCSVPNNYLEPLDSPVQERILKFNQFYEDILSFVNNAHIVNLYKLKERSLFTRHGLHFNSDGKIKICEMIAHKIIEILESLRH